jgi:hypothetical protein
LREADGVYKYGSKRVYVKIEKCVLNIRGRKQSFTQIFVRVGGGFMKIDDFIEQYEPTEVEKRERHNLFQSRVSSSSLSQLHNSKISSNKSRDRSLETI